MLKSPSSAVDAMGLSIMVLAVLVLSRLMELTPLPLLAVVGALSVEVWVYRYGSIELCASSTGVIWSGMRSIDLSWLDALLSCCVLLAMPRSSST